MKKTSSQIEYENIIRILGLIFEGAKKDKDYAKSCEGIYKYIEKEYKINARNFLEKKLKKK